MNDYIMDACKRCKGILMANDPPSLESIDDITGIFEMMKLEIEQHIANMPTSEACKSTRDAAQNAVRNISAILELLEQLPDDKDLIDEIVGLIDGIAY